jgi:hypothetical protein
MTWAGASLGFSPLSSERRRRPISGCGGSSCLSHPQFGAASAIAAITARHAERLKKDLIQVLGLPDSDVKLERLADRSWRVTYQTAQTRTVRAATLDEANQAQRELRKLGFTAEVTRDAGRP